MKKRDYGIISAGCDMYISFIIYEKINGNYKCYRNLNYNSKLYEKYKKNCGSEKLREKITNNARQGINKEFNNLINACNWVWGADNG